MSELPSNSPPLSHYVAKSLLKNWGHPRGMVTYFDFCAGTFATERAARMYVADVSFPKPVERWLDVNVEQPLGDYLARLKLGPDESLPPDEARQKFQPRPREWRAIALALLCQAGRTALARDPSDTVLTELAGRSKAYIDDLVSAFDTRSFRSVMLLPRGENLCLPDTGSVALPMIGAMGWFLPVHPRVLVIMAPVEADPHGLEQILGAPGLPSALFVGITGDRVVVPPMQPNADRDAVAAVLQRSRESAVRLAELFIRLNAKIDEEVSASRRQ
jgi:hypothetical protein